MAKTKMYVCQSCGEPKGDYMKKGYFKCRDCGAIWWTIFDRPSAGVRRKGIECYQCNNMTMQPIVQIANVEVWRCGKCATTLLKPIDVAN